MLPAPASSAAPSPPCSPPARPPNAAPSSATAGTWPPHSVMVAWRTSHARGVGRAKAAAPRKTAPLACVMQVPVLVPPPPVRMAFAMRPSRTWTGKCGVPPSVPACFCFVPVPVCLRVQGAVASHPYVSDQPVPRPHPNPLHPTLHSPIGSGDMLGCPPCTAGATCSMASACASGVCGGNPAVCAAPTCDDGVLNGGEVDVDCGFTACGTKCPDGSQCSSAADCVSLVCDHDAAACLAPTCSDGVRNGAETGASVVVVWVFS